MLAILKSFNVHNLPIFQLILTMHVSKFMVYRAISDKTYLSLGLLSPLKFRNTVRAHKSRLVSLLVTQINSRCLFLIMGSRLQQVYTGIQL